MGVPTDYPVNSKCRILSDLQCTVNEDIFEKSTGGGQDKGGYLH